MQNSCVQCDASFVYSKNIQNNSMHWLWICTYVVKYQNLYESAIHQASDSKISAYPHSPWTGLFCEGLPGEEVWGGMVMG